MDTFCAGSVGQFLVVDAHPEMGTIEKRRAANGKLKFVEIHMDFSSWPNRLLQVDS
jgi:hypothetical protein